MLNIGVIGFGYWGPNIARNFNSLENARVRAVCDANSAVLKRAAQLIPGAVTTADSAEVIRSPEIDMVAIVTPVSTHYELARQALHCGKHVFIEKPFTSTVAQAEDLIEIAERKGLRIMVDHTFIFTGAVRKIKELIDSEQLGKLYYYDSTRVNLGLFQQDVNVIWDLAPHDFSIMLHIVKERPVAVSVIGKNHINHVVNMAYITMHFSSSVIAHFNVNWLSPLKIRNTLICGEKKMLVWNDIVQDDKIKIYDKGVEVREARDIHHLRVSYRSGDMWAPKLDHSEALALECKHFVDSILDDSASGNDGRTGLEVVKLLEAADASLAQNGKEVALRN